MKFLVIAVLIFVSMFESLAQDSDQAKRFSSNVEYNNPIPKQNPNTLFYIQKNTNPNTVMYEGNRLKSNELDPENPVNVFWLRYQEDSAKSDLNYLQKKLAYGVRFEKADDNGGYYVNLVSYKKRKIYVFKNNDGEIQANMEINGKVSKFKSVFLNIQKDFFFPEIAYIDVFGEDLITGNEVHERIIP